MMEVVIAIGFLAEGIIIGIVIGFFIAQRQNNE